MKGKRKPAFSFAAPPVMRPMLSYHEQVARAKVAIKVDKRKRRKRLAFDVVMGVPRVEHKEDQSHRGHLMPGRYGKRWEYQWSDLVERAPYDDDMRVAVRNIPKLVDKMCPTLNGERRMRLIQNLTSIAHAKQRQAEQLAIPQLITKDDRLRARRIKKGDEKRERHRDAVKELKRLLKSGRRGEK